MTPVCRAALRWYKAQQLDPHLRGMFWYLQRNLDQSMKVYQETLERYR